jgi:cysteine-rich repeat protein
MLNLCFDAMRCVSNCSCFEEKGLKCAINLGCDGYRVHPMLYSTWGPCLLNCPWETGVCHKLMPEYCQRFRTSDSCTDENCTWCGQYCTTSDADCPEICGNKVLQGCEECDDGNVLELDGCDTSCQVEPGWSCIDGVCSSICGDGMILGSDQCDDGNSEDKDGCSHLCVVEEGWVCVNGEGNPASTCKKIRMATGVIAGIAVGSAVVLALIIGSAVLVVLLMRKKFVLFDIFSFLITVLFRVNTVIVSSMDGIDTASNFDPESSTFVDSSAFPVVVDPTSLNFGFEEGNRATVDAPLSMTFALKNVGGATKWKLFVDGSPKYTLTFSPNEGTLGKSEGIIISSQIVIKCTTSLKLSIPLAIFPKEEGKDMKHTFFPLIVETKLSTRLDPDEIRLIQPPVGEGSFGTVFRGTYRTQDVAVKVLKNQSWGVKIDEFYKEMRIMEELRNPFIVNVCI